MPAFVGTLTGLQELKVHGFHTVGELPGSIGLLKMLTGLKSLSVAYLHEAAAC